VEHIVIDGASRDRTLSIVHAHPTAPAHVLSEPDHGIYDAMNKGLALATGELIGFLNADDMLASPQTLARIADTAAVSRAEAVYGDLTYVRKDSPFRVLRHWRSGEFNPTQLRFGWMPPHPTFYVRRDALPVPAGFDLRFRIAADYDFMLRCLSRPGFRAAHIPEVLVRMRAGGASNRSLSALFRKSCEDYAVLRRNRVGGLASLLCKNARKLPQFGLSSVSQTAPTPRRL
jgi:glycosyltransferase